MTREEAIKEIKSWDFLEGREIEAIQTLIPELAESEDERIRKRLIEYFEGFAEVKWEGLIVQEVLAWLEKQKEQKPAEWSKEDDDFINMLILHFNYLIDKGGDSIETYKSYREKLKSLRPQYHGDVTMTEAYKMGKEAGQAFHWKPSEDEERLINTSISFLKDFADKGYENAVECIDWLKSKLNGNSCK